MYSTDWSREPVFLIGGGPSATRVDFDRLAGAGLIVAINDSAFRLSWADYVFTVDGTWIDRRRDLLREFKGRSIYALEAGKPKPRPPVPGLEIVELFRGVGLSDNPRRCFEGGNSGFAALSLAVARGATRIVLIGYDLTEAGHWHGGYEWKSRFGHADYPEWVSAFERIAPTYVKAGVDIVNLNPQSAVRCFRFHDVSTGNGLFPPPAEYFSGR